MADKPDPELDELLDSAAKDFNKEETKPSSETGASDASNVFKPDESLSPEECIKWQEEEFKKLMMGAVCKESGLTPEALEEKLKNFNPFGEEQNADTEKQFTDAISGVMQSLRENLSEAFPAPQGEGEQGEGDASNEMENLTNIMQQMMLMMLSKEMLLPSFKEMSEKYPGWLEENKSKLSEDDLKRYTAQLEVTKQIVAELEKDNGETGSEDDKQHLDRMVELMGKAQELGQPPQDLTAQLGNVIDDSKIDAMLKDSGADQCNIM